MLTERWRAAIPVVVAVVVVAALSLLTVTMMSGSGGDDRATADLEGSSTTSTTDAPTGRVAPRPTTTTTTTVDGPEVLGETTERIPAGDTEPVAPTGPPVAVPTAPLAPSPTAPPAPTSPGPTAPPATAPPTTAPAPTAPPTTVCRNSTHPACGEFSWSPEPGARALEWELVSAPAQAPDGEPRSFVAGVGETVRFAVEYVDPAGPDALGACVNWSAPGAETNVSSCDVVNPECPRTGPHDPPPASDERIRVAESFVYRTPGTYHVTLAGNLATHLADGCESPYTRDFSLPTFTITVS